ncbi:hypothetical protein BCR37DRAFT_228126 [Protomyces lactucae-debilis]|uniref:Uncharacterized protein n=1 Tax=Protomyces lactucae-debilis TaxID=2754530 RepID=A0A1Y2EQL6_PROLT|nr:uncharacterized protein BCR37DRAFT_228126 [Protomyces lactucae-debilis]ORY73881.1 hypothetical protein BCR37DRAFT_228126 [Protomyces lactucae-debilis]
MPGKSLAQVQRHFDDYLVERNYRQYLPRSGGPAALSEPRNDPPAFGYGSNKQSYSHYSQQQHAPVQPQQVPSGPSHGGGSYRPQPMLSVQGPGQYTSPYSAYNQGPPAPPQNQPMFPYGRPPEGPGGYMSMGAHPFGQAPQQSSYDYRGGPGGPPQHPSFHMHPQQLHHPHHPSMQSMPSQYGNQRGSFDMRHDRSGPPNIPLGPSDKSDRPLSRNSIDSILNGNPHPRDLPPVHRGGYPVNQNNRMGDGYPPHSQGYHNNGPRGPYYYPHQR